MDMLCRCEDHEWPDGQNRAYVAKVKPAGGTNEAIICGRCETPGDIYLHDEEFYDYEYDGKRLYTLFGQDYLQINLRDSPEEVEESLARDEDNPPGPDIDSAAETDW